MEISVQEFATAIRGATLMTSDAKVASAVTSQPRWQIVVCQRGWVFVGQCAEEGEYLIIRDAKCIRKWGTTNGLGQLAIEGRQAGTVLDESGVVRVHKLAIVCTFDCSSKWGD